MEETIEETLKEEMKEKEKVKDEECREHERAEDSLIYKMEDEPDIEDSEVKALVIKLRSEEPDAEMVRKLRRVFDYEHDIEAAEQLGEQRGIERGKLEGRNERISEHLRDCEAGDGVPHPGSGGSCRRSRNSIFELAREARR